MSQAVRYGHTRLSADPQHVSHYLDGEGEQRNEIHLAANRRRRTASTSRLGLGNTVVARSWETFQLTVEVAGCGIIVVRVVGELDQTTAPRLARLLDHQLTSLAAAAPPPPATGGATHLVVDLAGIRSFGTGGLDILCHTRQVGQQAGVRLHLTGLAAHEAMLPLRIAALLPQFSTFATLEQALQVLTLTGSSAGPRPRLTSIPGALAEL